MPLDAADAGRLGDIIAYGERAIRHLGSLIWLDLLLTTRPMTVPFVALLLWAKRCSS